jgi:hypothetical protein
MARHKVALIPADDERVQLDLSSHRAGTALKVIVRTLDETPRALELKPHRTKAVKLSRDPLLIEKVRTRAVVFCVDEVADSGAGSRAAGDADATGPGRASRARLPAT